MKFCVIGLGRFGYRVAVTLAENGMEVLAVDQNESLVTSIRDLVTQAVCLKVEDESSLVSLGVEEMDIVIVAMGENFAESVLITALAKKRLRIPRVITRAISEIHKDILKLIGADQVILPEQEIGIKLADNLSAPYSQLFRLTKDFAIGHVPTPAKFIGKTLQDINLFKKYQVNCLGIKQEEKIIPVGPDYMVQDEDILVCAGTVEKLLVVTKL